ncbi:Spore germination protein GerE [compost metagenome]
MRRQTKRVVESSGEFKGTAQPIDTLSARELELVRLLGQGYETKAIAGHLGLSEKTVRNNLTLLYEKLGVKNRVQAVLLCL